MKRIYQIIILVLLFLLGGCVSPLVTPTMPISTITRVPSTPTILYRTSTPTLSVNASQPTLSADEAKSLVFDLLKNNGSCELPCLWGLTSGKTDSQALNKFMSQFGKLATPDIYVKVSDYGKVGGFFLDYRKDNVHINTDFSYYENEERNRINLLSLHGYTMQERGKDLDWLSMDISPLYGNASFNQTFAYYLLPQILSNYGPPSQVWLKPYLDDPQRSDITWWPFILVLFYPQQGIYVEYVMPRNSTGEYFEGCPTHSEVYLAVWNPQDDIPLSQIAEKGGFGFDAEYSKSVEKATSMTLDQFYQTFKNPGNTACLETPQGIWQL